MKISIFYNNFNFKHTRLRTRGILNIGIKIKKGVFLLTYVTHDDFNQQFYSGIKEFGYSLPVLIKVITDF